MPRVLLGMMFICLGLWFFIGKPVPFSDDGVARSTLNGALGGACLGAAFSTLWGLRKGR